MSARTRVTAVDLDEAIGELVSKRTPDPVELYAGNRVNNGSTEPPVIDAEVTLPAAATLTTADPVMTFDPTSLTKEGLQHSQNLFHAAERVLDEFDAFSRDLRTGLREHHRQNNAANAAFIRHIHQIFTTVPTMKSQLRGLPGAPASGE